MSSVQTRALRRALEILGGIEHLEAYLDIPRSTLRLLLNGKARTPDAVFLRVVDLIAESELATLRETSKGARRDPIA